MQNMDTFKYHGKFLSATSNDIPVVDYNARKARKTRGRIRTLLKCKGADKHTKANFYKTIVQSILLNAAKTWQAQQDAIKPIEVFHNQVARHLSIRHIQKLPNTEIWFYPNMSEAFKELSLLTIQEYIHKRITNLQHKTQEKRPIFVAARIQEQLNASTRLFWGSDMMMI
jgi:hypothetical protein